MATSMVAMGNQNGGDGPGISPREGRGKLFVLSGPSGVGKDTVLDCVLAREPKLIRSVSATTRPPRSGEVNGVDYHFLGQTEFEEGIQREIFFEYALYNGQFYGTPRDRVEAKRDAGMDVVLKIEVQGAHIIKRQAPDAVLIFIQPPSIEELERRLRSRKTDTEDRIAQRLAIARDELAHIPEYDYLITNDDLALATDALRAIVVAERHRVG